MSAISRKHGFTALKMFSAAIVMLLWCTGTYAIPAKPSPERLVNDFAGVFTSAQTATLENTLVAYSDSTSTQIAIVTTTDLEGYQAAEYATRIGLEWQVGSEHFDNGVVILVKPKTGRESGEVFIAVGYGLEGAIPDAIAKNIINNIMIPRFIEDDYYGAVAGACSAIMRLASGEGFEAEEEDDTLAIIIAMVIIIGLTILLIAMAKNGNGTGNSGGRGSGRTIYMGPTMHGGFGGSTFGGSSGGGFGGFGGFGGGSFGGGGAGGRW